LIEDMMWPLFGVDMAANLIAAEMLNISLKMYPQKRGKTS
jgi:hypothetical protein